ncbi:MAG: endonuclease [Anaerolineaceae bacterium]
MTATPDAAPILDVYTQLEAMHAWRGWHWWPDADPFEVIVGSILVQNTNWANVERAIAQLKTVDALTPVAMSALADDVLEGLVRPSGQYHQKTKKLRAFLALADSHGGLEPLLALPPGELRAILLATWGIGEETADCIVVYASRQPAFAVDAYTRRIFSRLGMGPSLVASYGEWQRYFTGALPRDRDLWARYHALIVMHAKHLCRKLRPLCGECTLVECCPGSPLGGANS